jgi:hypothetical protein
MECVEEMAKEQGKNGIYLDTLGFQARPFYEKMGLTLIGAIENASGKQSRYFMQKTLA